MGDLRAYVILAVLAVFLVSACTPELPTGPRREGVALEVEVTDPCEQVSCTENQLCVEGTCVCSEGFKACGSACIAINNCCTSKECGEGLVCDDGTCSKRICNYNEVYDEERDECSCAPGTKYCRQQGQCIPRDNCCHLNDCPGDETCAGTTYVSTVCLKNGKTSCKSIAKGRSDAFFIDNTRYDVYFDNLFQGGLLGLRVNDKVLQEVNTNQELTVIPGLTTYVEKFEVLGGWCKDQPD